ncbi:hypothetical protein HPB48_012998 [Haemaphysalis longicornis]|uniref:Monocarboxylate transporter n=1 Tax=Haemaphysalis longicornis TaxID=44386 RepID=A0A9J6GS47_HAELO|nr:hypothetical protein HPB48_012998 [Haemaphysalis longicornis]
MNWTGRSLATFVFPSVIICLNEKYGLRGTFIIVGGLTLNAAAGCLFLRSPEELVRKSEPSGSRKGVSEHKDGKVQGKRSIACSNRTFRHACEEKLIKGNYSEPATSVTLSSVQARELMEIPPGNTSPGVMATSSRAEEKYTGDERREGCPSQQSMNTRNWEGRKVDRANSASGSTPVSVARRELGFLKRPILYVITLSSVVYACSSAFYSVTLADHAMGQGLPKWQAALLVSCNGVGDLIAQLCPDRYRIGSFSKVFLRLCLGAVHLSSVALPPTKPQPAVADTVEEAADAAAGSAMATSLPPVQASREKELFSEPSVSTMPKSSATVNREKAKHFYSESNIGLGENGNEEDNRDWQTG